MSNKSHKDPCSLFEINNMPINMALIYSVSTPIKNQPDSANVFIASNNHFEICYYKHTPQKYITSFASVEISPSFCCVKTINLNPGVNGDVKFGIYPFNGIYFHEDQTFELYYENNEFGIFQVTHRPFCFVNNVLLDLSAFLPNLIDPSSSFPVQLITLRRIREIVYTSTERVFSQIAVCKPEKPDADINDRIHVYNLIDEKERKLARLEVDRHNHIIGKIEYTNPDMPEREGLKIELESFEFMLHRDWIKNVFRKV